MQLRHPWHRWVFHLTARLISMCPEVISILTMTLSFRPPKHTFPSSHTRTDPEAVEIQQKPQISTCCETSLAATPMVGCRNSPSRPQRSAFASPLVPRPPPTPPVTTRTMRPQLAPMAAAAPFAWLGCRAGTSADDCRACTPSTSPASTTGSAAAAPALSARRMWPWPR